MNLLSRISLQKTKILSFLLLLLIPLMHLAVPAASFAQIYVDQNTAGANDGTSWTNAYTTLQNALNAASSGNQIWVAGGIYYPDVGTGQTDNDRDATFQLLDGVEIYGGFAGTETALDQRNWEDNPTILSGDIDGDDTTIGGVVTDPNDISGANSLHVVSSSVIDATPVLDGFTITGGDANVGGFPNDRGAGMANFNSSPTLTNVTFSGNNASEAGGGMYNFNSSPRLTSVTFTGNSAGSGGGVYNIESSSPVLTDITFSGNEAGISGGGLLNAAESSPKLTSVTFTGNIAGSQGGGVYNVESSPTLTGVTFSGNEASSGSGMRNTTNSSPTLTNVIFTGNSAGNQGGGMVNSSGSSPVLTNVTFSGNNASQAGGGMLNNTNSAPTLTNVTFTGNRAGIFGGGMYNIDSSPTIQNSIFWNNQDGTGTNTPSASIFNDGGSPAISHSLIANSGGSGNWNGNVGTDGGNNIDENPLFETNVNPGEAPTTDGDLRLQPFSPAIDAGTADTSALGLPATDLKGSVRVKGTVDIGACESGLNLNIPGNEGWRMMASPLASQSYAVLLDSLWTQGATGADVSSGTPNVYTWDEATASFQAVSDMSNVPGAGSGLVHYVYDDQDFDATPDGFPKQLSVTGSEPDGPVGIGVSSTDENSGGTIDGDEGWNLLGNPYSTPISVDEILSAAQIVDPSANANVYVWDHSSGSYSVFPQGSGHSISPWQSFWIRYTAAGVNGTMSLDRSIAKTDSAAFQKAKAPLAGLTFTLSGPRQLSSSFKVILDPNSQIGPDRKDAYRLAPLSADYVSLYAMQDQTALAHSHQPGNLEEPVEIPLVVESVGSDQPGLTLTWTPEQLPREWEFSLKDTQTGRVIELSRKGQYTFKVDAAEQKAGRKQKSRSRPVHIPVLQKKNKSNEAEPRFILTINPNKTYGNLSGLPKSIELNQNYPNPFNPETVIRYGVPEQNRVQLNVYDMLGRQVRTLINEQQSPGRYEARFDGSRLASGLYIYRLKVGSNVLTRKMMLIK